MKRFPRSPLPPAVLGVILLASCGGGGPTGPGPSGSPSPPGGQTVQVVVFYDENADGTAQVSESSRVPNVEVAIAGHTARSQTGTGLALVEHVPNGQHAVSLRADTLPPFFRLGGGATVSVPLAEGSRVFVPVILPIGSNQPGVYMAFGDSITRADLLPSDSRYPEMLEARLAPHFAWADVSNRGADATNTYAALSRIDRNLELGNPAVTLILYGTNDWHLQVCQDDPKCDTVPNLRKVVQAVKAHQSLPMIGTLPPLNPTLAPEGRNQWVRDVNELIKTMAREEGAFLVDVNKAFVDRGGDLSRFFQDDVHPNRDGNAVIADAFFQAIAFGRTSPQASSSAFGR
jgi:lysophospholipase L1-like esterase